MKLPSRILDWSHDDILEALARRGEDPVGNLLVGAESFERYQQRGSEALAIHETNPGDHYARCAQAAENGEPAGSSAGGEQPKFGAALKSSHDGEIFKVLVKFSPAGTTFSAERWRDLLICESVSLEILKKSGIESARGRLIEAEGRTFLESVRFDRVGARGRKGLLSLAALENEWVSIRGNWSVSALSLHREKKISTEDLHTIQKLECFGRLIANSDRHSGNLSFFWSLAEPLAKLAPVYDMLPMLYAPNSRGEDSHRKFVRPEYDHTLLEAWKLALPMAVDYWETVRGHPWISGGFRDIAEQNLTVIR